MSEVNKSITSIPASLIRYNGDLQKRLEKLSRTYDLTTMKIFITVESIGEGMVCCTYDPDKRNKWEAFLSRKEACRLDLNKHEKTRQRYCDFLANVPREEQAKQFHFAMLSFFHSKGATDTFEYIIPSKTEEMNYTFCGHLSHLFERKLDSWFDSFEAVAVNLTGHVIVSNLVRVLSGQIDALCHRKGQMYVMNVKLTGMETPRPLDIAELCLYKCLVMQNGLADPDSVKLCFLTLHLRKDRPILRLWEYTPTEEMEKAIREADVDKMIDAGKISQYHELWRHNTVLLPGPTIGHDNKTSHFGSTRYGGSEQK